MDVFANMKQYSLTPADIKSCRELQATAFLNMVICHYILKNYKKSIDNCQKSLQYNETIKAHYRLGVAYKAQELYEKAISAFEDAIRLDISDPNKIKAELFETQKLQDQKDKRNQKKMAGFFQHGFDGRGKKADPEKK